MKTRMIVNDGDGNPVVCMFFRNTYADTVLRWRVSEHYSIDFESHLQQIGSDAYQSYFAITGSDMQRYLDADEECSKIRKRNPALYGSRSSRRKGDT